MRPLAIDLYCGLGGWTEGLLAEGYDVVGFDLERRPYAGQLVLQDVLTLDGAQFRNAALIVGSSPCQEFSYRALPFKACKGLPPPELGKQLFYSQFRIQREASTAAGRHVPMVVENVRGAQPWVGRAAWHYGSYYLWGDVPAIMPYTSGGRKNKGGSWFAVAHNMTSGHGNNPDGRRLLDDSTKLPGNGSARKWQDREIPRLNAVNKHEDGYVAAVEEAGIKQSGGSWFFGSRGEMRKHNSHSEARKAASAAIAKIPFELARYIAQVYKPSCA